MTLNPIQFYEYGKSRGITYVNNTFIGGVSSTINTAALLAAQLSITSADIQNFTIVGSNIECYIGVNYTFNSNEQSYPTMTYWRDEDGKCLGMYKGFGTLTNCTLLYFPNMVSIDRGFGGNFQQFSGCTGIVSLPKLTQLGETVLNDFVFRGNLIDKLYLGDFLRTCNSGSPDSDLDTLLYTNIIYVTDYTPPNAITNLSIGNVYGTAIQLNFTAPTGSTNAIDFYEVYVNGKYNNTINSSGDYISGLTVGTSYEIEVKPVDIYYNKSTSNIVTQTTASTLFYQDSIVSYYKMENNVLDSWGVNNGTPTAITYAAGKVGNASVFNGTTSNVEIADSENLSFGNGVSDVPFSISTIVNLSTISDQMFIDKRILNSNGREYHLYNIGGNNLNFRLFDQSAGGQLNIDYSWSPNALTDYIIVLTYDGSSMHTGLKMYINGIIVGITSLSGTYVAMENSTGTLMLGKYHADTIRSLNGKLDDTVFWNKELTQTEVTNIYNQQNAGLEL